MARKCSRVTELALPSFSRPRSRIISPARAEVTFGFVLTRALSSWSRVSRPSWSSSNVANHRLGSLLKLCWCESVGGIGGIRHMTGCPGLALGGSVMRTLTPRKLNSICWPALAPAGTAREEKAKPVVRIDGAIACVPQTAWGWQLGAQH